ncbi:unnamed protein product [Cyprideis torosa]|uniref:Uncharacterized protein n=1 Tax=Cyprideis torosa TaxID=163714 RepID=A0A7R8W6J7_9CRUS|nr:unnamed protein product [Cyprideis torosa]CAG0884156.1 unnamed protein product [Cyprideis torosa]
MQQRAQTPCPQADFKVFQVCTLPRIASFSPLHPGTFAFSPDQEWFAWIFDSSDVLIHPWNKHKASPISEYPSDQELLESSELSRITCSEPVQCLAFGHGYSRLLLPSNKRGFITVSVSNLYRCWQQRRISESEADQAEGPEEKITILATGHNTGTIRIWSPADGKLLMVLKDHRDPVSCLAFANDSSLRLITGSKDKTLKGWAVGVDGNMFETLHGHAAAISSVLWSPNNAFLVSCCANKQVLLWHMKKNSRRERIALNGHNHEVTSCTFTPDGSLLLTASRDSTVIAWDPATGTSNFRQSEWDPATGTSNFRQSEWDPATGDQVTQLCHVYPLPGPIYMAGPNGSAVLGVASIGIGMMAATVCQDGYLRIWTLPLGDSPSHSVRLPEQPTGCTIIPGRSQATLAVGFRTGQVNFYKIIAPDPPSLKQLSRKSIRASIAVTEEEDYTDELLTTGHRWLKSLPIPIMLEGFLIYHDWV